MGIFFYGWNNHFQSTTLLPTVAGEHGETDWKYQREFTITHYAIFGPKETGK